ncbi:MAG: PQQ-binding-like beta-propeller repeat protein [Bacteroidales bacterium]
MISLLKYISTKYLPVILSIISFIPGFSQSPTCWSNFRGDPMLTGVTEVSLPSSPSLLWSFQTSDDIKAPPVICNNTIVVGSVDGNVYGLTLDGKLKWKLNTENSIEAPALIDGNTAYVGNLQGSLYAIELKTGRVKWIYKAENMIMGSPNIYESNGKKIIIVGSYDYYLHGVDANTGEGLWKYEADNYINGAPAIYQGIAVFGGCDGLLHMVDVSNGELINRFEIATYVASSAAIVNNIAYVGDYDGSFSALDLKTQRPLWVYRNEESKLPFIGSASVKGDKVLIGNRDRYMYCLNSSNGKLLWKVNTGSRVDASPVLTSSGVLVANMRGDILLMDPENGKITWSYELGSPISGNPAVTSNHIIVGAGDGRVYCLGKK